MAAELEHELVAVTGARGNLGTKLLAALLQRQPGVRLVALDLTAPEEPGDERIEWVACDLADPNDERWQSVLNRCTGLVHFAAKFPFPGAEWDDATVTMDIAFNMLTAAAASPAMRRVVFATSNHVMGRLKEQGGVDPSLKIKATDTPAVGTVWYANGTLMDSTIYAVPKAAGERLCKVLGARCAASGSGPSFVAVRIGWCQPGDNLASTLNAAGTPTVAAVEEDVPAGDDANVDTLRDVGLLNHWYRSMWLSNRDFAQIFERALLAPLPPELDGFLIAHGMSENTGMRWDLTESKQYLGYAPQDDVHKHLAALKSTPS